MKTLLIWFATFFLSVGAFAETQYRCGDTTRFAPSVGQTCVTTQGVEFVRFYDPVSGDLGWKDTGNHGVIWFDLIQNKVDQYHAQDLCKKKGHELPSREDFAAANQHGFLEIVSLPKAFYWSSFVNWKFWQSFAVCAWGRDQWECDHTDNESNLGSAFNSFVNESHPVMKYSQVSAVCVERSCR